MLSEQNGRDQVVYSHIKLPHATENGDGLLPVERCLTLLRSPVSLFWEAFYAFNVLGHIQLIIQTDFCFLGWNHWLTLCVCVCVWEWETEGARDTHEVYVCAQFSWLLQQLLKACRHLSYCMYFCVCVCVCVWLCCSGRMMMLVDESPSLHHVTSWITAPLYGQQPLTTPLLSYLIPHILSTSCSAGSCVSLSSLCHSVCPLHFLFLHFLCRYSMWFQCSLKQMYCKSHVSEFCFVCFSHPVHLCHKHHSVNLQFVKFLTVVWKPVNILVSWTNASL